MLPGKWYEINYMPASVAVHTWQRTEAKHKQKRSWFASLMMCATQSNALCKSLRKFQISRISHKTYVWLFFLLCKKKADHTLVMHKNWPVMAKTNKDKVWVELAFFENLLQIYTDNSLYKYMQQANRPCNSHALTTQFLSQCYDFPYSLWPNHTNC